MKYTFLLLALFPLLATGQSLRTISVSGEAEQLIEPDRLELTIVFRENENLRRDSELEQKEAALKQLVKSYGLEEEKLTVDNMEATRPGYYKSSGNRVYVSKVYKLQLEDPSVAKDLIFKVLEIGANTVEVSNLQSSKVAAAQLEVSTQALDQATAKAKRMAQHLGLNLGKVVSVQEQAGEGFSDRERGENLRKNTYSAYGVTGLANGPQSGGIRKIRVAYSVTVTYELSE